MDDKTIREAVEILQNMTKYSCNDIAKTKDILLTLAQRYLELSGVVGEKPEALTGGFKQDDVDSYNAGRQDTLLAVMHRLDGLERFFCEYYNCSDGEGNEYPECNMQFKNRCPQITKPAKAIRNAISGGAEKGEK